MNSFRKMFLAVVIIFELMVTATLNSIAVAQISAIQKATPIVPSPLLSSTPSGTPPVEERIGKLETQISELNKKTERRPKDLWDIVGVLSTVVFGAFTAGFGFYIAYFYRKKEIAISRISAVHPLIEILHSDQEEKVRTALKLVSVLGDAKLAEGISEIYGNKYLSVILQKKADDPKLEFRERFDAVQKIGKGDEENKKDWLPIKVGSLLEIICNLNLRPEQRSEVLEVLNKSQSEVAGAEETLKAANSKLSKIYYDKAKNNDQRAQEINLLCQSGIPTKVQEVAVSKLIKMNIAIMIEGRLFDKSLMRLIKKTVWENSNLPLKTLKDLRSQAEPLLLEMAEKDGNEKDLAERCAAIQLCQQVAKGAPMTLLPKLTEISNKIASSSELQKLIDYRKFPEVESLLSQIVETTEVAELKKRIEGEKKKNKNEIGTTSALEPPSGGNTN